MDILSIIQANLLTPLVLFFILGVIAARVKSDLKIPEEVSSILSIYLLAAIGLHGGIEMRKIGLDHIMIPIAASVGLSIAMTLNHYQILKRLGKFNIFDSYAIAAAYGSVGATSFSVGLSFLKTQNVQSEGFMAAILATSQGSRLVIAVSEDADPYDMDDIIWNLTTRVNPKTDIINPLPGGRGQTFMPAERMTAGEKEWTASNTSFEGGMGIDATVPFGYESDFMRPVYPVDRVDLKKWFTEKDIQNAKSRMHGWVHSLARTGR